MSIITVETQNEIRSFPKAEQTDVLILATVLRANNIVFKISIKKHEAIDNE